MEKNIKQIPTPKTPEQTEQYFYCAKNYKPNPKLLDNTKRFSYLALKIINTNPDNLSAEVYYAYDNGKRLVEQKQEYDSEQIKKLYDDFLLSTKHDCRRDEDPRYQWEIRRLNVENKSENN